MASLDPSHHSEIAKSLLECECLFDESSAGSADKEKARHTSGPARGRQARRLQQFSRNIAAVFGQFLQYGLVQPHVHLR